MNTYAVLILSALVLGYLLDVVTSVLNLKASGRPVPGDLQDVYAADEYRRSQEYTLAATRRHLVSETFDLLVLLGFWFGGGFAWLDGLVRSAGVGPVPTGLLFIGALTLGSSLLSLPFSVYDTFVLEARYGFNRTTPRVFLLDLLKGALLALLLGTPLLAAVLWFFEAAGPLAWVYAWLFVTAFTLLVQYVAPRFLLPLFNKFEPLEDGELKAQILAYAQRVHFPLGGIYVMDGSRRSARSNAFFTGIGRHRRIVLFDTLVERHSVPELVGILAHEVGHYKKKHIPKGMLLGILHTGLLFLLLSVFLRDENLYRAFFVQEPSIYSGLIFFALLYTPVELFLSIPMMWLSRKHEYEADRFAVETAGDAPAFEQALKKLAGHNLSNLTPHPAYVFLHFSHPPLRERLDAIRSRFTSKNV